MKSGSSPLARGPHELCFESLVDVGLIPARAGTTAACSTSLALAGAHPRSRGDHTAMYSRADMVGGSSPLARGPRLANALATSLIGLIPARAGTTTP